MYDLQEGRWVTPNGNSIIFRYRADTNDWNTVNACLGENDEYQLRGRTIRSALDVGGYLGSVGVTIAVDNPDAVVVIVEPVPWNAELIEANARLNGVGHRVRVFHGSAGPEGQSTSEIRYGYKGDDNLEHHAFVGNTSLAYDTGGDTPHVSLSVPTLGLTALLDEYKIAPDFAKIDCEGGEWTFLDTPDVVRLPYIIGEAHSVRGHKGSDIVGLLEATHEVTLTGNPEGTCGFSAVLR